MLSKFAADVPKPLDNFVPGAVSNFYVLLPGFKDACLQHGDPGRELIDDLDLIARSVT